MAGIGFELRKLVARGDLSGLAAGYAAAGGTAAGPWVLTVLTLAAIQIILATRVDAAALTAFRLIVTVNFALSLVLTGPVAAVATRFLADAIFEKDLKPVPGMFLGALTLALATQAPVVAGLHLFYLDAPLTVRALAASNYFLVAALWIATVFSSAVRRHGALLAAYGIGMGVGLLCALAAGHRWGLAGLLAGFTAGLALVFFLLTAQVFAEFAHPARALWMFLAWFRRHWALAAGGLVYNAAVWSDKWVFWASAGAQWHPIGLVSFPVYDGAMFFAFLSMLPALALFVLRAETGFFEKYIAYTGEILNGGTWAAIERRRAALVDEIWDSAKLILLVQLGVSAAVILLAPAVFSKLGVAMSQFGVFRLGVLGALFHVLYLFLTIVLAYFEMHRPALALHGFFLAANAAAAWLTLHWGFAYFGYGYVLASVGSFVAAFTVVSCVLNDLTYVTFVAANPSVRRA